MIHEIMLQIPRGDIHDICGERRHALLRQRVINAFNGLWTISRAQCQLPILHHHHTSQPVSRIPGDEDIKVSFA